MTDNLNPLAERPIEITDVNDVVSLRAAGQALFNQISQDQADYRTLSIAADMAKENYTKEYEANFLLAPDGTVDFKKAHVGKATAPKRGVKEKTQMELDVMGVAIKLRLAQSSLLQSLLRSHTAEAEMTPRGNAT